MQRFGLIGHPLGHSFSKAFFAEKFQREGRDDHRYDLFDLADLRELPQLLKETPGLRGLNVTIPHKEAIIPYLHELDPVATSVGAVNTITIQDGRLKGYNTDIDGFRALIAPFVAQWTAVARAHDRGPWCLAQVVPAARWPMFSVNSAYASAWCPGAGNVATSLGRKWTGP